jgi:hippurate hydrolase
MKKSLCFALLLTIHFAAPAIAQQSLDALVDREITQLVSTYKMLHAAPELSHYEEKTSAFFAAQLRSFGYTVTERVGKYDRPQFSSYGVVAVLKNRAGPTVLVRTDLDGLPVEEKKRRPLRQQSQNQK